MNVPSSEPAHETQDEVAPGAAAGGSAAADDERPGDGPADDPPPAAEPRGEEAGAADGAADAADGTDGDVAEAAQAARGRRRKRATPAEPAPPPPPPEHLEGAVEAIVLAAGDVVRAERLRDLLGLPSVLPVREALERIRSRWAAAGLAVQLDEVAGGVRVVTRPDLAPYVERLKRRGASDSKLARSLVETLSIVAYKQPVGRAEVERIRGVQAGEALRALLERALVKVVGRSDLPGRPLLYGTTERFLTAYGLNSLDDLPTSGDLSRM